jgi:N-acylneuraminate cytidylyltransferase
MIAQEYGAGVHWRSEENSNDGAMLADVLLEVLVEKPCDIVCCLLPCSPLIDWSALWLANSMLKDHNAVVPVVKYSQPYQRALRVGENGVSMLDPSKYNVRSQDLDPVYYDPGCFWFLKVTAFLEYKMLYPPDSVPFIMSELNVQDVDTVEDWEMLEIKYVRNNR